jgi:protein gp37
VADHSKIEWTDATWNPTRGCTEIAPGCAHCYAKVFAERFRGVPGHAYERGFDPRIAPEQLPVPLHWKKPRRIFVDSMSDLFHESFDFEYIAQVFAVMGISPRHTYQILTKRPQAAAEFFEWLGDDPGERIGVAAFNSEYVAFEDVDVIVSNYINGWSKFSDDDKNPCNGAVKHWPLPNVWIGTSIANQTDADKNIPHLLRIPAAVRFLSVEPLLGPIEFSDVSRRADAVGQLGRRALTGINWAIVGGESGPGSRPCNVEWIRSIVEQCKAADVPVFVKQLGAKPVATLAARDLGDIDHHPMMQWPADAAWGEYDGLAHPILDDSKGGDWSEWPADLRVRQFPEVVT